MRNTGTILQVSVSDGGVPKHAVAQAQVDHNGVEGDRQRDLRYHGGPDRAVCLMAAERIAAWAAEGHPIAPGSAGENITTLGLDWAEVVPGTRLRLGESVTLEITDYAQPCKKNQAWFKDGNFNRMNQRLHPGSSRVYARVLVPGTVRTGDPIATL